MNRKLLRRMTLPLIAACVVLADCTNNTTTSPGPTTAFALMRFTPAGAFDPTFAGGGITTTDIDPGLFDFAIAAAVQTADNNILAGGSSGLAGSGLVALVRYSSTGMLDGTFGSGGIVRTTLPNVAATASAIAVQPGGKILVAALTFAAGTTSIALLRYNANGTLDTTGFGSPNGYVTAAIGSGVAGDTCALALQADGKIVVAGASQSGNVVLYRYDTLGVLDPNFGTNGTGGSSTTNLGTGGAAVSPGIALQSTGKIILVSGTNDQVVLRYNTDGTLDTSFGPAPATGIVTTDINNGNINFANAVAVQFDDKIVVAGHANVTGNTSDISLVRYNADGTLDTTTFGNGTGIVTTDLFGQFDNAFSVALQTPLAVPTNILVSGNTGSNGFSQALVLRYDSTGAPDTTFNSTGFIVAPLVGPSNIASGNAVVLQTTGGIIVAGYD